MDESLTEQRRVSEDGLRVVKLCYTGRTGEGPIPSRCDGTVRESHG